jgi:hypothetical protein
MFILTSLNTSYKQNKQREKHVPKIVYSKFQPQMKVVMLLQFN